MSRGRFISFEGGEGCGKSTQVRRLQAQLEKQGIKVLLTREPGGTWLGEQLRRLIKDQREDAPCEPAELLLFLAARAQLVRKVIRPALESGIWVVSDRFSDSTFAYQGYGRGLDLEVIRIANDFACSGLQPDLTLFLDLPTEIATARRAGRECATATAADRIESAGTAFHERVREGFVQLAASSDGRIRTIDASRTEDEVWEAVWKSVLPLI